MRKLQCFLFVLKRSYICYYIICMTVPLIMESPTIIVSFLDVEFIAPWFSLLFEFFFLSLTWRLLLCTNLHFLSLGDLLPLWLPWIYWTRTWWGWWSTSLLLFSNDLSISFYLLKMPSFKNVFSDSRYLTPSLSNIKSYDFSVESSCILFC